jgi:hypothetical protein
LVTDEAFDGPVRRVTGGLVEKALGPNSGRTTFHRCFIFRSARRAGRTRRARAARKGVGVAVTLSGPVSYFKRVLAELFEPASVLPDGVASLVQPSEGSVVCTKYERFTNEEMPKITNEMDNGK